MNFMRESRKKVAKVLFKELFTEEETTTDESVASKNKRTIAGELKRLGLRGGDITSKDFQEPEFDMAP